MDHWPVLINAPEVLAIEIRDSGDALVDASNQIRTAPGHPRATSPAETRFHCRSSVLNLLVQADAALPEQIDLVLTEAHRPLELQQRYWETDLRSVQAANPTMTLDAAIAETARYVAPLWIVPPH